MRYIACEMISVPTPIKYACAFVARHHRHCKPPNGGLFAVGVAVKGETVGVAIVATPVARPLANGITCEITRLCVLDGVSELHVCSHLYGKCVRIAREMGYEKVITYTLEEEPGTSLIAAGFHIEATVPARDSWNTPSRSRTDTVPTLFGDEPKRPTGPKKRWARTLKRFTNVRVEAVGTLRGRTVA